MADIRPYASHNKIQVRFVDGSDVPAPDRDDFEVGLRQLFALESILITDYRHPHS